MRRLCTALTILLLTGMIGCATGTGSQEAYRADSQTHDTFKKKDDIRQNCLGGGFGTLYCKDPGMN